MTGEPERARGRGAPAGPKALLVGFLVFSVALLVALAYFLTPWQTAPPVASEALGAFSTEARERSTERSEALGLWPLMTVLGPLAVAWALWWWLRRRQRSTAGAATASPWWVAPITALAWSVLVILVQLPSFVRSEQVSRSVGVSRRSWVLFTADIALEWAVTAVVALLAVFAVLALTRLFPRIWAWWAAGAAAALVVVGSFLWPLVVPDVLTPTEPLRDEQLDSSIQELARRDGMGSIEVDVAQASHRTTAVNAYVSGIGATHRVVVWDTALEGDAAREQATLIVAHEFGHVVGHDVEHGTVLGALGAATLVLGLGACALTRRGRRVFQPWGRGWATASSAALALALVSTIQVVTTPAVNAVSRQMEVRADQHALDLTCAPEAYAALQVELTERNVGRIEPPPWWHTALFGTHPTSVQRISHALQWQPGAHTHCATHP